MTEDLDQLYRRAAALDPSRPSEAVRRKVLEHAAGLTAKRPASRRARWRPAVFGTLAAAGLAGLLIVPRIFSPQPSSNLAETAARGGPPPARTADAAPMAAAPALRSEARAPQPSRPPRVAARSRPIAGGGEPVGGASRSAANAIAEAAPGAIDPESALRLAAENGDVPQVRTLLDGSLRIDAPDAQGRTALMLAVLRGRAGLVDLLLSHGADPNAADAAGTTPLEAALAAQQPAIADALRRAGAR